MSKNYPRTPDGRYFLVRGRLWRCTNPDLTESERTRLVKELMAARRDVKNSKGSSTATRSARERVQAAKEGLGERGEVWWKDGAPDCNQKTAQNTSYAEWFGNLKKGGRP